METHLCYLMHKDIPVLSFKMNDHGMCCSIEDIYDRRHLPPGIGMPDDIGSINRYLTKRQLNKTRRDVHKIMSLKVFDPSYFLPFHFVSAFDCYWIKYENEILSFADISFYNKTDEDFIGMTDVLTYDNPYGGIENVTIMRDSPNLTINASVPTFIAFTDEGESHILFEVGIKDKSIFLQEKYAKFTTVCLGSYSALGDVVYYDIKNPTNPDLEYIPFSGYYSDTALHPENAGKSDEELLFDCLKENNFPDWEEFIKNMISLDEHFGVDRQLDDFGVFRNPQTLKVISFAPIYCYPVTITKQNVA